MKKQFLLFVGTVFAATTMFAQQQISNASFETWSQTTNPDGWFTIDSFLGAQGVPAGIIGATTSQDTAAAYVSTTATGGSSSLLLSTALVPTLGSPIDGDTLAGFAQYSHTFSGRPDSVRFWISTELYSDTVGISFSLYSGDSIVGAYPQAGYLATLTSNVPFHAITVPVNYVASLVDSAVSSIDIQFVTSLSTDTNGLPVGHLNTKVHIDDIQFVYSTPTGISNVATLNAIKMYPNPASSVVTVEIPTETDAQNITIVDMNGRLVKTVANVSNKTAINVENLNTGSYVVTFSNAKTRVQTGSKTLQVKK